MLRHNSRRADLTGQLQAQPSFDLGILLAEREQELGQPSGAEAFEVIEDRRSSWLPWPLAGLRSEGRRNVIRQDWHHGVAGVDHNRFIRMPLT